MILEGIVTTVNDDQTVNVAPMGPIVDETMTGLWLRPFKTSQTYQNLKRSPEGILHVVDDVLLLARAAIGRLESTPPTQPAVTVNGRILKSACRWYEFQIEEFDDQNDRTNLRARVVHTGRLRDFFGFNRAKHAVVEAAILATRVHLLPKEQIVNEFADLKIPVEKTAGPQELAAFELLENYVTEHFAKGSIEADAM